MNTRFCHSMSNAYLFSLSSKIATLFSIKVPSCICVGVGAVGREEEDPSGANAVPGSSFVYFTCTRTWSSSNLIALKMCRDKR